MTQAFTIKETENNGLKRAYDITISADYINGQIEEELKKIGQQVKIPGFRPGKVPMNVLKQRYVKNTLGDVLDKSVNAALDATYKEHSITPALKPDVKIESYKEGSELTLTASLETMPEAPEVDFSSIEIQKPKIEIGEEEIGKNLTRLAEGKRTTKDRAKTTKAKEGNIVIIDFKGFLGDEAFPGGEGKDFSLELGSGQFIPGFEDQLIGAKAGEEKEVNVTFPEAYHSADLAGKEARFEVTVHTVQEVILPEIDDALAKEYNYDDLEKLKAFITEQLEKEYESVIRNHLKKQLFDQLEERCQFDVPETMTEMEFDSIWKQFEEEAKQSGTEESEIEAQRDEYRAIAKRRVQLGILLSQTAGRNKIEITQQDMQSALMAQARMYPGQEQKIFEFFQQNPAQLQELRGPILEEKAVDFILDQVKQVQVDKTLEEFMKEDEESEDTASSATEEKKPAKKAAPAKKKAASTEKKSEAAKKPAAKSGTKKTAAKKKTEKDDA